MLLLSKTKITQCRNSADKGPRHLFCLAFPRRCFFGSVRGAIMDVLLDTAIKRSLCTKDVFNSIATSTVTAFVIRDEIGFVLNFLARISHRDREPTAAHDRQIDDVITDVR